VDQVAGVSVLSPLLLEGAAVPALFTSFLLVLGVEVLRKRLDR
jgi:hypothetical protein